MSLVVADTNLLSMGRAKSLSVNKVAWKGFSYTGSLRRNGPNFEQREAYGWIVEESDMVTQFECNSRKYFHRSVFK